MTNNIKKYCSRVTNNNTYECTTITNGLVADVSFCSIKKKNNNTYNINKS